MKPKLKLLLNAFLNHAHKFSFFFQYYNLAEKAFWHHSRKGTEFIGTIQLWFLIHLLPLRRSVNLPNAIKISIISTCPISYKSQLEQWTCIKGPEAKIPNVRKMSQKIKANVTCYILMKFMLYIYDCTVSSFGQINVHFPREKRKCLQGYS